MNVFDYATPYDIMVGRWAMQSIVFDPNGEYLDSMPSFIAVYWKKPQKLIHFRQDEIDTTNFLKDHDHKTAVVNLIRLEFDLKVRGKYAEGGSKAVKVIGAESRPDAYHFHLQYKNGHWYNNHHCISPNERHILGPFVPAGGNGGVATIVAQTLTRISYDVPKKYRCELR